MRMLSKGVAVRAMNREEITGSGIVIPEAVARGREQNYLNQGEVVYVAKDVEEVKVGDIVIYIEGTYWKNNKRKNLDEIEVDGEELIFLKENEIKAIIYEEEK